jgi:hypothetical protein
MEPKKTLEIQLHIQTYDKKDRHMKMDFKFATNSSFHQAVELNSYLLHKISSLLHKISSLLSWLPVGAGPAPGTSGPSQQRGWWCQENLL